MSDGRREKTSEQGWQSCSEDNVIKINKFVGWKKKRKRRIIVPI